MHDTQSRVNNLIRDFMRDMEYSRQQTELEAIRKDPKAHRFTRLMADGKPANWRYFSAGKNGRGSEIRFCWTSHKNAAGYYLCFREVVTKRQIKRDMFDATPSKKDAIDLARRRAAKFQSCRS